MEAHLCNKNLVPTEKMIKELVLGQSGKKMDTYTCGSCSKKFQTICVLHYHCMKHSNSGSYFFNHVMKTAFPKFDSISSYTQVDEGLIANDLRREIADADVKVMMSSARDINNQLSNKESKMESDNAGIETAFVGIEGSLNDLRTEVGYKNERNAIDKKVLCRNEVNTKTSLNSIDSETYINTIDPDMIIPDDNNTKESPYDQDPVKAEGVNNNSQKKSVHESKRESIMVTVRNIDKTSEGLFSFEMDEKDAYLFDRTAESIMDRIRKEGEEWISDGNEFQIKVSLDKDQLTEEKSCVESKAENENNTFGSGNNLIDSKADTDNEKQLGVKNDNIQDIMIKEKTPKKRRRGRPSKKQISNNDKEVDYGLNTDNTAEAFINETVESEPESSQNSRRSGRKRQVSSRLRDADWEISGKMKHKRLSSPSNKDQTDSRHGSEKDSNATRTVPGNLSVEIKEETDVVPLKSDALRNNTEEIDNDEIATNGDIEESKTVKDVDQTSNGNTYSADLSASEVLLSLSKGSKEKVEEKILDPDYKTKKGKLKRATNSNTRSNKVKRRASKGVNSADGTNESKDNELPPSKRKDYTCPTCGKVGNLAMMKYHEQCHSTDKPFTCEVCGKGFKTRPCLVAHVRQHGERQFRCDQCPAAFYRKQYLTSHLLTHSGELPYVCKTCNKGFRELYILHRHNNNVHKNIRNFPCDLCSMMFFRQETLDNHRVRHFPPTLKCNYCSKMFKAELDRRKHELTHTGEKQFFCPKCSYGFSQLWPYYRHMWKKHNINKDEAKRIRIRNKNLVANRNVNKVEEQVLSEDQQAAEYNAVDNVDNRPVPEDGFDGVNIIYEIKQTPDAIDEGISQYREGQIVIQQGEGLVTQSNEMVVQSNDDLAVQATSEVTDLKGIYDHLYVTDAANVANAIQVLTGNLQMEEGTVIMETHEEHPDTGDVSMVQQNIVILSDYSGMEGEYSEIDGYTKEYSSLDL